jgi:hypothetical protein
MVLPREGHIIQLLHIFPYLIKYLNTEMVLDPSDPVIDASKYQRRDWTSSEFGNLQAKISIPPNMPEPIVLGIIVIGKVNVDHAADIVTRRSITGFLFFIDSALVYWFLKKQNSVETNSFDSEFIAMKQCCEYIKGLKYKLQMMVIP